MPTDPGSATFWNQDDAFVAADPRRATEADEVARFAASHEATRGLIFFQTSGSEGLPKWCGLSREAMQVSARAVNAHLRATAGDRWLVALPLHHVGGFSILARCVAGGASFVRLEGKWDAAAFADRCATDGISLSSLVPTQVHDLVRAGLLAPLSLRAIVVGGAGMSRELGQAARDLGWPVLSSYGMTETASQVATAPLDEVGEAFDPGRLEVLAPWELGTDEDGSLTVRGAALAAGYAIQGKDGWRWEPIDGERGLRTRDRVRLSQEGGRRFLQYLGRESSFVKILGELVNVAALQSRLDALAAERGRAPGTAVVWPVDDARSGTRLVMVTEVSGELAEELREAFNAAAAGYERLGEMRSVPGIPRTALGKIDRVALERLLAAS